jgi:hypothetical protein
MATTRDDIDEAKEDALDAFDDKLVAARKLLNSSPVGDRPKMLAEIQDLRKKRTDILMQDYIGQLNSTAMNAALAAIKKATADMSAVAPNMTSATAFISSLTGFLSAAGKVIPALKGH